MSEFPARHTPKHSFEVYNKVTRKIVDHFRTKAAAEHVVWCRTECDRVEVHNSPWAIRLRPIETMYNHPLLGDVT